MGAAGTAPARPLAWDAGPRASPRKNLLRHPATPSTLLPFRRAVQARGYPALKSPTPSPSESWKVSISREYMMAFLYRG